MLKKKIGVANLSDDEVPTSVGDMYIFLIFEARCLACLERLEVTPGDGPREGGRLPAGMGVRRGVLE